MRYCSCEIDHKVLVPAEHIGDLIHIWCPDCQRIVQFTAVVMGDGMLHWMPGDWRAEADPILFGSGVYIYS